MHTYSDDRGYSLMSVFDHLGDLPGQFNVSAMYAGAVKAWHRHARQDDHWVVIAGDLKIGLFNTNDAPITADLRLAGPGPGAETLRPLAIAPNSGMAVHLGEHRPGVLRIPAGLWHGGVAIGGRDALLLYHVTRKYDPRDPDEERKAWNELPFSWALEFKQDSRVSPRVDGHVGHLYYYSVNIVIGFRDSRFQAERRSARDGFARSVPVEPGCDDETR